MRKSQKVQLALYHNIISQIPGFVPKNIWQVRSGG